MPITKSLTTVPIRPLNKGMITSLASNALPAGSFKVAKDCIIKETGVAKRSGYTAYAGGDAVDYPPVRDVVAFWSNDGEQETVVVDSKFMYIATVAGLTGKYYVYDTGTVTDVTSTTVTGNGTLWDTAASDVAIGDVIFIDDGSSDITATITAINSDTELVVDANSVGNKSGSFSYEIRRAFNCPSDQLLDIVVMDHLVIFTDGTRAPLSWDGTDYTTYSADITEVVDTIAYHKDRFWGGRVQAGGLDYRDRIVWTSTTDRTDFTPSAADLSLDLPYTRGRLIKLQPLGDYLIAYYQDAVYAGRPSNIAGNALPLVFHRIHTGGIGIVGKRAVCSWLDGNFFIGQDDIYFLSNAFALQQLRSPVRDDILANRENMWASYVVADPANEIIRFGIPGDSGNIEKIWNYSYKLNAWSYEVITSSMLAMASIVGGYTWDTLDTAAATWDDIGIFGAWNNINSGGGLVDSLYLGQSGILYFLNNGSTLDLSANPITLELVTGDYDLDAPDNDKTFYRLSIKTEDQVATATTFTITGSRDRGNNYLSLGTLTIPANSDEGFLNFKITGSTVRFKIQSSSQTVPFKIIEYTLKVGIRGMDVTGGRTV